MKHPSTAQLVDEACQRFYASHRPCISNNYLSQETPMRTSVTIDGVQLTRGQVERAYAELQRPEPTAPGTRVKWHGTCGRVVDKHGPLGKVLLAGLESLYGHTLGRDEDRLLIIAEGNNVRPLTPLCANCRVAD